MPGIFTHYSFALDAEEKYPFLGNLTPDQRDAFRLGSQGPDPLLFAAVRVANPRFYRLGSRMHSQKTSAVIAAFARSWRIFAPQDQGIARAYAMGFLCHYLLDRAVHPLVYAQQYSYCDAGVKGLDRLCGHEVHAAIEMELDELMIRRKMGSPGAALDLSDECLAATDHVLSVISRQYVLVCATAMNQVIPTCQFGTSVRAYRTSERICDAVKRNGVIPANCPNGPAHIIPWMRELGHTGFGVERSDYTNDEHWDWPHPHGESEPIYQSFDELYALALKQAGEWLPKYCDEVFTEEGARVLTGGRNFSGKLVEACL